MKKPYKFFLVSSLLLIYLVIAAGAIVRMTGSGMGCPDWPKCFGYIIPPIERFQLEWKADYAYKEGQVIILDESLLVAKMDFITETNYNPDNWEPYNKHDYSIFNPTHTWIEFLNRLLGAIAGLATLFLFITALFRIKKDPITTILSFVVVLGMGFQAWLGKTVVDSNLLPFKITIHMGMALLIVLFLIFLLQRENKPTKILPNTTSFKVLVFMSLVLTLIQIGMGTQVRQFVDEQIRYWGLAASPNWLKEAPLLFYIHRSFSLIVLGVHMVIFYILYNKQHLPIEFLFILVLIVLEILTGIWMYYFEFPFSSQPLHLFFASLLFGAQSYFMIRIFEQR